MTSIYENFKGLPFTLDAEKRNQVSRNLAQELAARLARAQKRLLDSGIPTMKDLGETPRLLHYVQMTHPDDFVFLQMDDYLDKARQGMLPVLRSPRWVALMSIPDLFNEVRRDFLRLYRQKVGEA